MVQEIITKTGMLSINFMIIYHKIQQEVLIEF